MAALPVVKAADPPPEVDAKLRDRMQAFYQLEVDHKFRQAEALVAEDTKDYYYNSQKPEIKKFKILEIKYAPDFMSAEARVATTIEKIVPIAGVVSFDLPAESDWKFENGDWFWHVDQDKLLMSPFGKMHPGPAPDGNSDPNFAPRISVAGLMSAVQADRRKVELSAGNSSSATVTLKNTLPGPVTIEAPRPQDLQIEIAKPNLGANESTSVTFKPLPDGAKRPASAVLKVQPTGQTISIGIDWKN